MVRYHARLCFSRSDNLGRRYLRLSILQSILVRLGYFYTLRLWSATELSSIPTHDLPTPDLPLRLRSLRRDVLHEKYTYYYTRHVWTWLTFRSSSQVSRVSKSVIRPRTSIVFILGHNRFVLVLQFISKNKNSCIRLLFHVLIVCYIALFDIKSLIELFLYNNWTHMARGQVWLKIDQSNYYLYKY